MGFLYSKEVIFIRCSLWWINFHNSARFSLRSDPLGLTNKTRINVSIKSYSISRDFIYSFII